MVREPSGALNRDEHVELARALLSQRNERLILRVGVPGIERLLVGELHDDYALGRPVPPFREAMAPRSGQIPATVLGNQWPDSDAVLIELGGVGDDVLCNEEGWHGRLPPREVSPHEDGTERSGRPLRTNVRWNAAVG